MEKIDFVNNDKPALNATNLNKLQDNIEDALEEQAFDNITVEHLSVEDLVVDSIRSKNMAMKNNNFVKSGNTLENIPLMKLSANKIYCVSYYTNLNTSSTYWYFKDANGNNVFNFEINNSTSRVSKDFTPTQDIYFVGAYLNNASTEVYDFQIEEGDTPTTYASYQQLGTSDTGWVELQTEQGFTPTSWNKLKYRKKNGTVCITGSVDLTEATSWTKLITTLPEGCRPPTELDIYCRASNSSYPFIVAVNADGTIRTLSEIITGNNAGSGTIFIFITFIS